MIVGSALVQAREEPAILLRDLQEITGTPYYLPLIRVENPATPTPVFTPTATTPSTWYGVGIYDDRFSGISYMGSWVTADQTSAFQSTTHYSISSGNQTVFHFEGEQISLVYTANTNRGMMDIWIDGIFVISLNQYSSAPSYQRQWDSAQLSSGHHTIILQHASGVTVDVDGLIVSNYAYPPGPGVPPPYSTSYYMKTIDTSTMYTLGCTLGIEDWDTPGWMDSLVVLDYGMPRDLGGGVYGASLFSFGPVSTATIAEAVKAFGYGYYYCSLDEVGSHLRIGVGTSNYGSYVTYNHGRAWAQMVNQINSYFSAQGFFARVDAIGMNDMELSWNTPSVTRNWVNGYDSANEYYLYNFGDAAGCPSVSYPSWTCNNSWTLEDVWYISYGAAPSYPLPLIYANGGINARQWQWISRYGYTQHGAPMEFQGEMTQWLTCQTSGCEDALDNTPAEGWTYLWDSINSDFRTAQEVLRYSTDIKWWGY